MTQSLLDVTISSQFYNYAVPLEIEVKREAGCESPTAVFTVLADEKANATAERWEGAFENEA